MSDRVTREAVPPDVDWLSPSELDAWLSLVSLIVWLPWSLDQQLQRDSGLAMTEYQVLAKLSESPDRTLRMSSLASVTNASLSRLSHLVKRLEARDLVARQSDPADGRFTNAILTEAGHRALVAAAPKHVAHVRQLMGAVSAERFRLLGQDAARIVSRIDTNVLG